MKNKLLLTILCAGGAMTAMALDADIVATQAYRWHGDTITQGQYKAYAPTATSLLSTYSAQPGYYMPIEKEWHLKNDISAYPALETPNVLHTAIYNMGLDEMVNAVEPDTTLRTGKEWAGVWTRDVSYSILLSMSYLQTEASKISLMKKVTPTGRIIQDTGSGGAWPVSSDRLIWSVAAYEIYKVTGEQSWLDYIYPIIRNSVEDDLLITHETASGLVNGETSFIDWREQSHPRWMQTADIYKTETLSTSIVHYETLTILAKLAAAKGDKKAAERYGALAQRISDAINEVLWMADKGYYAMYTYGRQYQIVNPRAETLGESLAILYGIADTDRARIITENHPTTPFGVGIFFPQISDMPPYHNNALWPWVGAYWALANAKAGNEAGLLEAIGAIYRPAALFCTNKENFVLDNGDIATELNSSNMLWCLSGNLALTHRILFGITFEDNALRLHPVVPKALAAERTLRNFNYRGASLDITVKGYGNVIKSCTINGRESAPTLPGNLKKGKYTIVITLADNEMTTNKVNRVANAKAPLTPITWTEGNTLHWNPIEYIGHYKVLRNGKAVATTRCTTYDISTPGVYQVVGVSTDGIESFASQPVSTNVIASYEMPGEGTTLASPEVSYMPKEALSGYHGAGFVEVDHHSAPITVSVNAPAAGRYALTLTYANGNGPVNTENKCCVRTISVNGNRAGIVVMPHRGVANWNDWGASSTLIVDLAAGANTVTIDYRPENENMNLHTNHAIIDRLNLELLAD